MNTPIHGEKDGAGRKAGVVREPVEIQSRRAMTPQRKFRIHQREKGKCWLCTQAVPLNGPEVIYDHKLPLELGGSDDDENIYPIHRSPCDQIKTKADRARIDKAKRLGRKASKPRKPSSIRSRGFDTTKTRGFDGKVRARKART